MDYPQAKRGAGNASVSVCLKLCSYSEVCNHKSCPIRVQFSKGGGFQWSVLKQKNLFPFFFPLEIWLLCLFWEQEIVFKDDFLLSTVDIDFSDSLSKKPRHNAHWVWISKNFWFEQQSMLIQTLLPMKSFCFVKSTGENQLEMKHPLCLYASYHVPWNLALQRGSKPIVAYSDCSDLPSQSWGGEACRVGEEMWNKGPKSCPVPHLATKVIFLSRFHFLFAIIRISDYIIHSGWG